MTSPWQSPEPEPAVRRLARRERPTVEPEPPLLHDPARFVIVAGAVLTVLASPLPWLTKVGNPPPETRTGWSGIADGFLLAVIAVILTVLALNRDWARTRSLALRLLPVGLALAAVALVIGSVRTLENQIEIWERSAATGVHEPALYICLAASLVTAAGATWLGIRRTLEPTGHDDPADRGLTVTRKGIAWAMLGTAGTMTGAIGTAAIVLASGIDPVALSLPLLIGVLAGGLVGAYAGGALARRLLGGDGARRER